MENDLIVGFLVFLLGACLGSFANGCIYRLSHGISIVHPRSFCPNCKHSIAYYDLIPIVSYFILKGRCRHCRAPISIQYPIVETLYGIIFTILFYKYYITFHFVSLAVFCWFLVVISIIDLKQLKIFNKLTIPGILIGLAIPIFSSDWQWLNDSIGGLFSGAAIMIIIYLIGKLLMRKEALGFGDIKFGAFIGVYLGISQTIDAIFLGCIIATFFGLFGVITGRFKPDRKIPLAPFVATATGILISTQFSILMI